MKKRQLHITALFTSTLIFTSIICSSTAHAEDVSASQVISTSARIAKLQSQLEAEKKSLEAARGTLIKNIEDRKKVANPDSQFQLGTIEAERSLDDTKNKIKDLELSLRNLKSSEEALAVCTRDGERVAQKAKDLIAKIDSKLKSLDSEKIESDLTRSLESLAKLKQEKSPAEAQQATAQKDLNDLLLSGAFKRLSDTFVDHLTSSKQLKFSRNLSDIEKSKFVLALILNPTLLDDVDQASKNARRATDNLIGRHTFSSDFIKAIAAEGVFPPVKTVALGNNKYIPGISSDVANYLQEKSGITGLEGISLSVSGKETMSNTRDRIINAQIRESLGTQNFSNERAEIVASAQLRTQLEAYLDSSISRAKALSVLISKQQDEIEEFKRIQDAKIASDSKKASMLQSKAHEVRALKRLRDSLASSANTCTGVETAVLKTIDEVLDGKLSAREAINKILQQSSYGLRAIKEIDRIQKQPAVHGLVK